MIKVVPNTSPDDSLSFEFYLDSIARIRTIRDMEWVEDTAETVNAKLIFTYKQFYNNWREKEWELKLALGRFTMDFQTGSYLSLYGLLPCSLLCFQVSESSFVLRGNYMPMELRYDHADIVFFDCQIPISITKDGEWLRKFQNFKQNVSEIPFSLLDLIS
jgi:ASC-1-like (ASCH) protein